MLILQDFDPAEMPRGKRAANNEKKVLKRKQLS